MKTKTDLKHNRLLITGILNIKLKIDKPKVKILSTLSLP